MAERTSFTIRLDAAQQQRLADVLATSNYRPREVEHAVVAAEGPDCNIALYKSGKCLVQGRGARDWVTFVLEPVVLQEARLGYEDVRSPELFQPHMGIDESGKGDFFGPLVIAAAYTDARITESLRSLDVRDSKTYTSDTKVQDLAKKLRNLLGHRFAIVTIGPRAYNRLYASMRNVNRLLAWGHARAIENLLEKVPQCPRAVADQFGPKRQIEQALMKHGRRIQLEQRPRAESDPAVAAASVLARAEFVHALGQLQKKYGVALAKGASDRVREAAAQLARERGPEILLDAAKCHFRTTDQVLQSLSLTRTALGKDGLVVSRPNTRKKQDEAR